MLVKQHTNIHTHARAHTLTHTTHTQPRQTPQTIRDLLDIKNFVIVVEHDLR